MRQAYIFLRAACIFLRVIQTTLAASQEPAVPRRGCRPIVGAMTSPAAGSVAGSDAVPIPTLADIERARDVLEGVSIYTPMEESRWLSALAGGPVRIKAENLQRTGSFKIRGAYLRMSRLSPEEKATGVVAASAGNHAQGVALAAQMLGIHATVFMPEGAPIPKEKATRGYGAEVRFHGHSVDDALVAARAFSEETGAVLIHPFDHVDIVTGQGTCGLEIVEQCPDVKTVVVPCGGGGFLAGIATAVKELRPQARVVGVQAEGASAYPPSLSQGRPVALEKMTTMADGIAVGCPGWIPFTAVDKYVDDFVTVSEESLSQALLMTLERAKLVVEPAGAAAVAAMMDAPDAFETPAVVVLSGGNVDPLLMMRVIRHGLAAAGRYLYFRARIPDVPGGLARLLAELASLEANVLDVVHERTSPSLHLDEVEVLLQVETRGEEHAERVLSRLRECGYAISQPV
jgi:threonine dehydratase